ncbi:Uma2 family endonuclease [Methylotuvimicrobium buryatense]|uniref:Uma2 family endonuclease n=1 Tax=Methylotuvimicrobium buryatense TaxID=95641 RepID=A0A4P9UTG6_METBY|nr:Uma2 family endonuclease [Methylotuvimicrobium buryatense]QCW83890.1 Uma2 family endonuclease [Methylotuvimicrobium buryatense]
MRVDYVEHRLSEADYLEGEQDGQIRHELIDGIVCAMTGASDKHNKINGNVFAELRNVLKQRQSPCTAYINDMKVKVQNDFYYPDVMVVYDRQNHENDYYKTSPVIIIEVLSPTTRRIDKTLKREAYQSLELLQEYVLIEQDKAEIEVFTRQSGWQAAYYYLGDTIYFESIDTSISVEDIYYQVDNEDVSAFIQEQRQS